VALHLAIGLEEGAVEAGMAGILLEMGLERARGPAHRIGAVLTGQRTAQGISYTVAGALEELDYLAWVLRQAASEPERNEGSFVRARARARARVANSRETPSGVLDRRLRRALLPGQPHPDGTLASLDGLNAGSPVDFWNRTHGAGRMSLVVVGDVAPVTLLALSRDLGAPPELVGPPLEFQGAHGDSPPRPQILRTWYAEATPLPLARDPRNRVLAILMDRVLEATPRSYDLGVQLWELGDVAAVVVTGAAYSSQRSAMRDRVSGLLRQVREILTPGELQLAVGLTRDALLYEARTPWGRAALIGGLVMAGDPPNGGRLDLETLEGLEVADMLQYLDRVLATSTLAEELRP
jgi:predicted Zn-dependent peptidase